MTWNFIVAPRRVELGQITPSLLVLRPYLTPPPLFNNLIEAIRPRFTFVLSFKEMTPSPLLVPGIATY